jgi:predicted metal-dependent peptidase
VFNLNDHIFRLLQREPFFAALSRRIEKTESKAIPTAGVRVNPDTGYYEMMYNSDFFEKLTDEQRSGVLVHEFYHLVFEHVTGRLPDELEGAMVKPTQKQMGLFKLWNIATDLSINCHIGKTKLPENCCFPGVGMFEDFAEFETGEFYYEKLKEKLEEEKQKGEGGGEGEFDPDAAGQFDDHGEWGNEACDETTKDIMDRISTRVDWRKVLRWFVKCSQRSNKRSTPRRLNKRYAYIHPGRKTERVANIAVSIDQSGSVSDEMLALFYAELNKLADIASFTVIPFDTQVAEDKVYAWKKGEHKKRERVLHGGTNFDAPTEYVNKGNFDGHIVLTDMCAPKPKPSKCSRLWMTDQRNGNNPYFQTNERIVIVD